MPPRLRARLGCESLEVRENPAPLLAENFDALKAPTTAYDFSYWGTGSYVTSKIVADSGTVSLASTGNEAAESRYFSTHQQPADVAVSASVYSNTPTPAVVFARGQNLTHPAASYLGVRVHTAALTVDLVEFSGGTTTVLATLSVPQAVLGTWLDVTLTAAGTTLSASVRRADTMEFLAPDGSWQPRDLPAVTAIVSPYTGPGSVGLGRSAGGAGMAFFDNFQVSAVGPTRENFNTPAVGTRPDGWKNYASDGTAGFAASTPRAAESQGYTATGGTNTVARSWLDTAQPADVQASALLYADTLIPGTLLARGSALDTAKPTYYGVTVNRGLEASLVRVVDGVTTSLGTIKSKAYVSGVWLRLTLTASGDTLRAVISRPDTNQWLTPDGTWSDAPQPALEVTDKVITAGGFVGVQRNARAAGPVTFDDFEVSTGAATGPKLAVAASQAGTAYAGDVTFTAADDGTSRRVEYRLNGKLVATASKAPATFTLDTTALANGPQVLTVRATDNSGNPGTATVNFTTANANPMPQPARPTIPQKLPYIRVAQLAYSGNPLGDFEQARLKDSVDLVIPNPKFLATIDAASPTTPQAIYSNISNLYQGLLTNWLSFADANKADREAAFYHVSQPTPFSGGSPSSQPVAWFWSVSRDGTDLTSAARGGQATPVAFGGSGSALSVGFPEKFTEVNLAVAKPAAAGWSGTLEYVSAVDATGSPTVWKPLTLTGNGTASFTKAGAITFALPTDWVPSRVGSGDRLFTIRVRTTAGGAADAPTASTVLGRDYVNANGATKGTIPAFDAAADKDGDGYLSDAEYAARAAGKDARFSYESRLFYPYYGQSRFVTNPSSAAVRNWAVAYQEQQLALNPLADGVFLDNSNGRLPTDGAKLVEGTETYGNDYAAVVSAIVRKLGNRVVVTNTTGGGADATPVVAVSTVALEEFLLRPTDVSWAGFNDVADLVKSRLAADSPSPYVILDSLPGSFPVSSDRVKSSTLAYYYLLADSSKTFLMLYGGDNPSAPWSQTWIAAIGTDVGQAKGAFTTFASGSDPQNAKLEYKVMARQYDNALVLFKPRSYALGQGTGTADDATATTHDLGGNYRVLHADGSLGSVVTSITLRNGEGVVLMKA
jgi:hypothetical protein